MGFCYVLFWRVVLLAHLFSGTHVCQSGICWWGPFIILTDPIQIDVLPFPIYTTATFPQERPIKMFISEKLGLTLNNISLERITSLTLIIDDQDMLIFILR